MKLLRHSARTALPTLLLACLASAPANTQSLEELGSIEFENSGGADVQEEFVRGVLLLHSFEYEDSAEAFQAAQRIEPGFALAYWGEALTHYHPIWREDDAAKAMAALRKLAPTVEERRALAPTEREKGLLDSVELLFGEGPLRERTGPYSEAMARLHARYPADLEIAAFYSISILGTVPHGRDVPTYMRGAAIAEKVYEANPAHPGALHYAIHAYDDPVHAPLGLRMARRYATTAPAAQHALHMPSHIFVALGMWADSASSNEDSSRAADERRERKGLSLDARGYHSMYWLLYTYLQQGRVDAARELLEEMVHDEREAGTRRTRYHLALMRAAFAVNQLGSEDVTRTIETHVEGLGLKTIAADYFVGGASAAARGDVEAARATLEEMRRQRQLVSAGEIASQDVVSCCNPAEAADFVGLPPGRQAAIVLETELAGLIELADGEADAALELLRSAALGEDGMDMDFGPPDIVKPAHELLGEVLLELERPAEAAQEFEAALRRAPRRALSLLGLARARAALGDAERAREAYAELADVWSRADAGIALLEEVRSAGS